MKISLEACSWWNKTRKTLHVTPWVMIDRQKIEKRLCTTISLSWLFWTVGIIAKSDE